jgi:hypothetical protein
MIEKTAKKLKKPKTMHIFDEKKKAFVEIMRKKFGIISRSCKEMGIVRSTYDLWMKACPEFAAAIREVPKDTMDFVECKLFEGISDGDVQLIKFYLDRKAKSRGYGTSTEFMHSTGNLDTLKEALDEALKQYESDY